MKKISLFILLSSIVITSYSQKMIGNWELKELVIIGDVDKDFDKMLDGDGLELHLGNSSHFGINVFYSNKHKVKHKDTWYEGDEFIILNDQEWGSKTYNIISVSKKELTLERMLKGGVEVILKFEKKNSKNHHFEFVVVKK